MTRLVPLICKVPALSAVVGVVLGVLAIADCGTAAAAPAAAKYTAVYQLRFAGLTLGKFTLWSTITGDHYALQGNGKITFLASALFELSGGTVTNGALTPQGPQPDAFSFTFETKKGTGQLAMTFDHGAVRSVQARPTIRLHPDAVPVTEQHLQGVLDPLTALFFSTEAKAPGNPASACEQRVPVYDGKYRFDLLLTHKRTVRVVRKKGVKTGYEGPAVICKVKYIPVAGHAPDASAVTFMAREENIEVWLIPLPEGRAYVPYHLSLPTPYGTAQATSVGFHVLTAGDVKFAVVQ